jgi:hypothetical protein
MYVADVTAARVFASDLSVGIVALTGSLTDPCGLLRLVKACTCFVVRACEHVCKSVVTHVVLVQSSAVVLRVAVHTDRSSMIPANTSSCVARRGWRLGISMTCCASVAESLPYLMLARRLLSVTDSHSTRQHSPMHAIVVTIFVVWLNLRALQCLVLSRPACASLIEVACGVAFAQGCLVAAVGTCCWQGVGVD